MIVKNVLIIGKEAKRGRQRERSSSGGGRIRKLLGHLQGGERGD